MIGLAWAYKVAGRERAGYNLPGAGWAENGAGRWRTVIIL